jgi:hypothetical protein
VTVPIPTPAGSSRNQAPDADEFHRHLTTLQGWRRFTTDKQTVPESLSAKEWRSLSEQDRLGYDEARLDYHTRLSVVATSTLRQVVRTGRRLTLLNRHAISARRGLILSGAAGTGKTTAITQFGKTHELIDQQRHQHGTGRIPVVYATVPPAATPRMLAAESRQDPADRVRAACRRPESGAGSREVRDVRFPRFHTPVWQVEEGAFLAAAHHHRETDAGEAE